LIILGFSLGGIKPQDEMTGLNRVIKRQGSSGLFLTKEEGMI